MTPNVEDRIVAGGGWRQSKGKPFTRTLSRATGFSATYTVVSAILTAYLWLQHDSSVRLIAALTIITAILTAGLAMLTVVVNRREKEKRTLIRQFGGCGPHSIE